MTTLTDLLKEVSEHPSNTGVCNQPKIKALGGGAMYLLRQTMKKWPKYSGDCYYPVPSTKRESPIGAYHKCVHMRSRRTVYGSLRWELLYWLIKQPELDVKIKTVRTGPAQCIFDLE